jgi:hypothetical protein
MAQWNLFTCILQLLGNFVKIYRKQHIIEFILPTGSLISSIVLFTINMVAKMLLFFILKYLN